MSTPAKQLHVEPFETPFGMVNPGDMVAIVTTYSHNVSMSRGKYLGYILTENFRGDLEPRVKLEVEEVRKVQFWKDTGKEFDWKTEYNSATYRSIDYANLESRDAPYTRKTTLQLNRIVPLAIQTTSENQQ